MTCKASTAGHGSRAMWPQQGCLQAQAAGTQLAEVRRVSVPKRERELCDKCAGPIANMRRECTAPACRMALCLTCCKRLTEVLLCAGSVPACHKCDQAHAAARHACTQQLLFCRQGLPSCSGLPERLMWASPGQVAPDAVQAVGARGQVPALLRGQTAAAGCALQGQSRHAAAAAATDSCVCPCRQCL